MLLVLIIIIWLVKCLAPVYTIDMPLFDIWLENCGSIYGFSCVVREQVQISTENDSCIIFST